MKIKSLAHVCIKTANLEKTIAFYCDALGMETLFTFTRRGEVIGLYMKAANDTFIEAFLVDQAEPTTTNHTLSHFCLETDAIEELRQRLLNKGYSPWPIKTGADKSLQFWIEDPNGIKMEFHQYNENSSQVTGQDIEVSW